MACSCSGRSMSGPAGGCLALCLFLKFDRIGRPRPWFCVIMSKIIDRLQDKKVLVLLLLAGIVLATYMGVGGVPFNRFDDVAYVTGNPRVQQGLSWDNAVWALTTLEPRTGNWHPLTWLSHMLDTQLFGLDPTGHHLTNLALHLVNVLLLFGVLHRLTGALWRSAMVAALFGLHPLNVESVAWIAERKNVLSTFFWLLTMWAYAGYVRKPGWGRYLGMTGLFVLGLMSKPVVVTLPCVLLLLDYWPLERLGENWNEFKERFPGLVVEKLPLLIPVVVTSYLTIQAQSRAISNLEVLPLAMRAANAVVAYALYLTKMVWPANLAIFYPHPLNSLGLWPVLWAVLALVAISLGIGWTKQQFRYLEVGWLWYLGTLVPVIGLAQVGRQAMADRYAYVPLIGLFFLCVWGSTHWLDRHQVGKAWRIGACVCLLFGLSMTSRIQLGYWQDNSTLFEHAIQVTENNFVAHYGLGSTLLEEGKIQEAQEHFSIAVDIKPNDEDGLYNMGVALMRNQISDGAAWYFSRALGINPNHAFAHNNLGALELEQGRLEEAAEHFSRAVESNPLLVQAHNNLGAVLMRQNNIEEAIASYGHALQLAPHNSRIHNCFPSAKVGHMGTEG